VAELLPGAAPAGNLRVRLRYFGAARAVTAIDFETVELTLGASVGDALALSVARHGDGLARVLLRCSYLLQETAVRSTAAAVVDGDVIDVLPPFAGG